MRSLLYLAGWFFALFLASTAVFVVPLLMCRLYLWLGVSEDTAGLLTALSFIGAGLVSGVLWWDYCPEDDEKAAERDNS
jgi:hypothetical protein